jgi:arylsulfatase A-like enzyme
MSERPGAQGVTRRELLQTAAVPPAMLLARSALAQAAESASTNLRGKNVVMFITDQDRAIQHFPPGWAERNLPGLTFLRRHGLEFTNAFTDTCMCSPARSTLMSGYIPAQHGVKYTLEQDMQPPTNPQVELPTSLPNIATVMAAAGYRVTYKGKWHCSKPAGPDFKPHDLDRYGFHRWDPPDAGANQDISECGGGYTNNDGRYMSSQGKTSAGAEGVLEYLQQAATEEQPFCLIVSLVNPRRVALPQELAAGGLLQAVARGGRRAPADGDRGPVEQAERAARVPQDRQHRPGRTKDRARQAQLHQLLRQPDAGLGRKPCPGDQHVEIDRAARRHADHSHRRARRDGSRAQRYAAEELQRLRRRCVCR